MCKFCKESYILIEREVWGKTYQLVLEKDSLVINVTGENVASKSVKHKIYYCPFCREQLGKNTKKRTGKCNACISPFNEPIFLFGLEVEENLAVDVYLDCGPDNSYLDIIVKDLEINHAENFSHYINFCPMCVKNFTKAKIIPGMDCHRCGSPFFKSQISGYAYQCFDCDEDFGT